MDVGVQNFVVMFPVALRKQDAVRTRWLMLNVRARQIVGLLWAERFFLQLCSN